MTADRPSTPTGEQQAPVAVNTSAFWGESKNLDFIRSFAVLLVVTRHVLSLVKVRATDYLQPQAMGVFAVLLFFVLTSLVLQLSLERHEAAHGDGLGKMYESFLVRRVARIYPLSCFVVIIAAIAIGPFTAKTVISNLFLVQNLTGVPSVVGPMWSLPLEMQMYLLLPLLFLAVRRYGVAVIIVFWVISCAADFLNLWGSWAGPQSYMPAFLPGVVAYGLSIRRRTIPFWVLPIFLAGALELVMFAYAKHHGRPETLGAPCLVLGFLLPFLQELKEGPIAKACAWIAKYSYGIYLFHGFWLVYLFPNWDLQERSFGVIVLLLAIALSFGSAVAGYHVLEAPMIRVGSRLARKLEGRRAAA